MRRMSGAALVAAALLGSSLLPLTADASARPAHIRVTLNRTSIPATGVLQPRPARLHIDDPHGQVRTPYVVDPVRPKVTAHVTDASGHPVSGATVHFHARGGVRFGRVHDRGGGIYRAAVISSSIPGPARIWATTAGGSVVSRRVGLRQTFGALHTNGAQILDAAGHRVHLRGVAFEPAAPNAYLYNEFPPRRAFEELRRLWHVNVVRVLLDLDQWQRSCPVTRSQHGYDPYYRSAIRSFVRAETERGVYVILALGKAPRFTCDPSKHYELPAEVSTNQRADANRFWHVIAETFKSNPLVGFDLYNEPHSVPDKTWLNGGPVTAAHVWVATGMQEMYNRIRGTAATNLVFVEGPTWATRTPPSLVSSRASRTWQTDIRASNLVYAVHYYSCQHTNPKYPQDGSRGPYKCANGITPPAPGAPCPTSGPYPAWDDPAAVLDSWVAWRDAHGLPVMENEFGWPGNSHPVDKCFIRHTIAYDEVHHIPWVAFHWVLWHDRVWGLARHPGEFDFRPTVSGCPVFHALTRRSCPS